MDRLIAPGTMVCSSCGRMLELPADLTAVYVACPNCRTDNVLAPELIQARQRQYDELLLANERARQAEQQRLMQARVLAARRAASKRSTVTVLVVIGVLLLVPLSIVGGLFALGIVFGKKAVASMQELQDPKKNGMPAILEELSQKRSQGCERLLAPPEARVGSPGLLRLELTENGPCVHLMGATATPSSTLKLEQVSQVNLVTPLPPPAATFDYRLCPQATHTYEFSVSSSSGPFSMAAIACPRTVTEGLVRSKAEDPVTTGVGDVGAWASEFRARGCHGLSGEPAAVQGSQSIEVDSTKGGPCFNLLVKSHFEDAPLKVRLLSPSGRVMAEPSPATKIHIEYCPSETGRHRVEIVPSTRDHYAWVSLDCPRSRGAH